MKVQEVSVESDGVTLAGTLTVPEGAGTVVVLVHGSGPLDRDQNSATAPLNTFATLSEALTGAGFATLRYDKRGVGASGGDYSRASQDDLTDDLVAWIGTLTGFSRVILCGHSEGTVLAPVAAGMTGNVVDGMILICPYAETGEAILRRQAKQLEATAKWPPGWRGWLWRAHAAVFGGPVRQQARLIAKVKSSAAPTIRVGRNEVPARWLRSFIASDPMEAHRKNTRPTLIIAAGQDVQCLPGDADLIAAVHPQASVVVLDDLSHILRPTDTPGVSDYPRQLAEPTDPRVAAAMIDWLS